VLINLGRQSLLEEEAKRWLETSRKETFQHQKQVKDYIEVIATFTLEIKMPPLFRSSYLNCFLILVAATV
jgi:hypothetical protein